MKSLVGVVLMMLVGVAAWGQQTFVRSVDTVAALVELNPKGVHTRVMVSGTAAADDGGGGVLWWDSASTTATNATTVFKATGVTTGRWKRLSYGKELVHSGGLDFVNSSGTAGLTINTGGNITKLNGVTTSFPGANASGFMRNNGSGTYSLNTVNLATSADIGSSVLGLVNGGTGGTSASGARNNIAVWSKDEAQTQRLSGRGALYFDGTTANARTVGTLTGYSIGTADFTTRVLLRVPTSVIGLARGIVGISSANTGAQLANGYHVFVDSAGILNIKLLGASTSDYRIKYYANFVSDYAGKAIELTIVRDAVNQTITAYVNGSALTLAETTAGTPPTWAGSVSSAYLITGIVESSYVWNESIYEASIFNYALSSAQVVDVAQNGISYVDQWRSGEKITASQDRNFGSAGVGNWVAYNAQSTLANSANTLQVTGTASYAAGTILAASNFGSVTPGKRYRVSADVWRGTTANNSVTYYMGGASASIAITGVQTQRSADMIPTANGDLNIFLTSVSDGGTYFIDNVTITQLGCVCQYQYDEGVGYQAIDQGAGKFHGEISNGGISHLKQKQAGTIQYGPITTLTQVMPLAQNALPPGVIVQKIIARNTTANAITGFILGTTSGGSDVVASTAIGANATVDCVLANNVIAATTARNLWANASAWNSGSIELTVIYQRIK